MTDRERLASMGVKITRPPGPMSFAAAKSDARHVIALMEDPDGYQIELIETAQSTTPAQLFPHKS